MMLPMKAIWIEQADDIDFTKIRNNGIDKIYLDIRQEYNPIDRVDEVRTLGFKAGVYWGANWGELDYPPEVFASYISGQITIMEDAWRKDKKSLQCEFQFDFEWHMSDWMERWLRSWRQLRPLKTTSWTLESYQGGLYTWMEESLVSRINDDVNLQVIPQLYNGPMTAQIDSAAAAKDLRFMVHPSGKQGGIREDRIRFFYDARAFPSWGWDGFLFTNRTLP